MTTQANMTYKELLDLFFEAFEDNQDTNKLADALIASTQLTAAIVGKAQAEASRLYAKNAF